MDRATKTGIWIIATGVIIVLLKLGENVLAPFALAVFVFFVIEGLAQEIDERSETLKRGMSRAISVLLIAALFTLFIFLMIRGILQFADQANVYETRLNALSADVGALFGMQNAPTVMGLLQGEAGEQLGSLMRGAAGSLSESFFLVLIYTAFLYVAYPTWSVKLDQIFRKSGNRQQIREMGDDARRGIEAYLWTQTIISTIITLLTYITLTVLGVQNALFLSGLIFILNYIPTIGSIVAAFVPLLFALAQGDMSWPAWLPQNSYINAAIVFSAVSFWQFTIGNFVQPRMMGDSLNLSALVVLLALAIWGEIWGITGMFLSAPLTVIMMIGFAQHPSTRWIAILLSQNGDPDASKDSQDAENKEQNKDMAEMIDS